MQNSDLYIKHFNTIPANVFGHCLFDIRQAHGLSQKAVALDADMDQSYLAGLETGRRPPPRERQLKRLFCAIQATEEEKINLKKAMVLYKIFKAIDEFRIVSPMGSHEPISLVALHLNQIYQNLFEKNEYSDQESAMS